MNEPQEGHFNVLADLNFCNEAVFLSGETQGFASVHHEGDLAYTINETVKDAGGQVTGDAALYI